MRHLIITLVGISLTIACQSQEPCPPCPEPDEAEEGAEVEKASIFDRKTVSKELQQVQAPTLNLCDKSPGPDLKIVGFSGLENPTVKVKNVGKKDAVFDSHTKLVAGANVSVPAGGRITVGQVVDVQVPVTVFCKPADSSSASSCQALGVAADKCMPWTYNTTDPVDEHGWRPLVVDPSNKLAECNEGNNAYWPPLPAAELYESGETGLPDLVVDSAEANPFIMAGIEAEPDACIRVVAVFKNVGAKTAVFPTDWCDPTMKMEKVFVATAELQGDVGPNAAKKNYMMHEQFGRFPPTLGPGKDEFEFRTGETRKTALVEYCPVETDQFGVESGALRPGCTEMKIVVDPDNQIEESNECNNVTYTYVPTVGASCPPDKQTHTPNSCEPKSSSPLLQKRLSPTKSEIKLETKPTLPR